MIVIIDTDYSVTPPLHTLKFGGEFGSEFSRQMPSQSPTHQGVWFSWLWPGRSQGSPLQKALVHVRANLVFALRKRKRESETNRGPLKGGG